MNAFMFLVGLLAYFVFVSDAQFGRSQWLTAFSNDLDLPPYADEATIEHSAAPNQLERGIVSRAQTEERAISKALRGAIIGGRMGLLG
ncbi:hypothetical protein Tcan_09554 [Toxocara canis]|uniref:Uncharacterized protein n=1 Tax=Toxocara canis TaxID=6265 RepID=A0A0B2VHK6_TOXCA|nr:hypothetical protein Tcan_09554 [Toxocara canis]